MSDLAPGTPGQGNPADGAGAPPVANPSTAAAVTQPPAAAPAAAPASPIPWLQGADDLTVGYVQNKGWTEPAQVLEGYRNLEKLFGADRAGNTVVIPKSDAAPEELGKFYDRLGRPSDPAGYQLQVPQGADPEFAKGAAAEMHKLGLTKAQAQGLAEWNNARAAEAEQARATARQQDFETGDAALRKEWGAAWNQNLAAATAAKRGLGLSDEMVDKLQGALGHADTMKFLASIGAKVVEPGFVAGDGPAGFSAALTPAQAQAKIAELKADKGFVAKYTSGDAGAKAEMTRLLGYAYPEP